MAEILNSTPRQDGFHMPAEHEPQDMVWIGWPERPDCWRLGAKPAQAAFAKMAEAIAEETPVTMLVSQAQYNNARATLSKNIRVVEMSMNDTWLRDTGPSFLVNDKGDRRAADWQFNAWGGLVRGVFYPWDFDDAIAGKVCEIEGVDRYRAPFVLEGGSIRVDGDGTLYTTEECLLCPSRNPDMSKKEIEQAMKDYLGLEKVIWLPRGLYLDVEATGHIDNLLHVVKPGEVVLTWCDDPNDPQYEISREALSILESTPDAKGRKIKVHKLPMPGALYMTDEEAAGVDLADSSNDDLVAGVDRDEGKRIAASYANFLITNNRIILPLLDETRDSEAAKVLEEAYPGREVVGVPARDIVIGGGNVHCVTQQQPARRVI